MYPDATSRRSFDVAVLVSGVKEVVELDKLPPASSNLVALSSCRGKDATAVDDVPPVVGAASSSVKFFEAVVVDDDVLIIDVVDVPTVEVV